MGWETPLSLSWRSLRRTPGALPIRGWRCRALGLWRLLGEDRSGSLSAGLAYGTIAAVAVEPYVIVTPDLGELTRLPLRRLHRSVGRRFPAVSAAAIARLSARVPQARAGAAPDSVVCARHRRRRPAGDVLKHGAVHGLPSHRVHWLAEDGAVSHRARHGHGGQPAPVVAIRRIHDWGCTRGRFRAF